MYVYACVCVRARASFLLLHQSGKDWKLAQTQKCVEVYAGCAAWQVSV